MSKKYGKFNEHQLADKLINVSKEEMEAYFKKRMKKYKIYYFSAAFLGVISVLVYIFIKNLSWLALILAILGILLLGYGGFQRERWKRLFSNMVYLKNQREKKIEEQEKQKRPYKGKDKYSRN